MKDTPYPPHTPPPAPEGMKWEYRGMGWNPEVETTAYSVFQSGASLPAYKVSEDFQGRADLHFFEAVPIGDGSDASWKATMGACRAKTQALLDGPPPFEPIQAIPDAHPARYEFKEDGSIERVPDENPKEAAGRRKCPMHLLSPSAMRETANALGVGAAKYGPRNYRKAGINATTYVGAMLRHIVAWNDGEDLDESGLSHIAHVSACCDILLDCMATGMMNDDRSKKP